MKKLRGLLIVSMIIILIIGILGLVGVLYVRGSFAIPILALGGVSMTLNNKLKSIWLNKSLQIICCVVFIVGLVTMIIPVNQYFISGLLLLSGILVMTSSIILLTTGKY